MIQNEEFINEFVEEAQSHLEMIEVGLLKMEEGSSNSENINNVFRSIHSIKGTAGFFGLDKIVELAHVMETLLGEVRNGKIVPNTIMVDHLLGGNDQLKRMVGDVYNSEAEDVSEYVAVFTALLNQDDVPDQATEWPAEVDLGEAFFKNISRVDEKVQEQIREARLHGHNLYKVTIGINRDQGDENLTPITFFKKIQSVGEMVDSFIDTSQAKKLDNVMQPLVRFTFVFTTVLEKKLLPIALDIPEEEFEALKTYKIEMATPGEVEDDGLGVGHDKNTPKTGTNGSTKEAAATAEDSIRVQVSLLNDLLNLASEMVLGRNQLLRNIGEHRKKITGLDAILQNVDRITTELQEKIMQTRMQPVGNVFNKMPRVTRDLSKKLGKEVELYIEGSQVELDKSIIESLSDPLTHLIRNAIDHGLETPDKRKFEGKPTSGNVALKAYHEGGYVHIDIIDDGAGIDVEKIMKKGIEKHLVTEQELILMSEQERLQLLLKPGFSTAEKVTDVSGRGVGLDVVKTNIEKLGGTIEITTKIGKGTTFRLILPLTLAIIPSLVVEVSHYKFALPQANLQEMVRIKPGDKTRKIEYVHNAKVLRLRGKLLPIVHLGEVLGIEHKETGWGVSDNEITRVLVLKVGSKRFGLVVDRIHDEEEILVKPLPVYFKPCQGYSGVTIMGDGKTAMILDPDGIIAKANLRFTEEQTQVSQRDILESDEALRELQNMLLFKCSGDEMFAIDLSLVSRVEEIHPSQIERIGNKEYIKYRGEAMRVIRPENHLPVTKNDSNPEKLYVIIPKLVANPIGFIIEKIHDTVMTAIKLNKEEIKGKGLVGSAIINDRIVLLINMYEVYEMVSPEEYEDTTLKNQKDNVTILLAEDTPFFARLIKHYLEWAGYHVILADNGKKALAMLYEQPVDLVLSDIQMPEMDGLELARQIRKNPDLADLPLVALTSMTGDKDKKAGIEAGFDYYEFKLDKITLLETLKKAMKVRKDAV